MDEKRVKVLFLITKSTHGGAQQYVYDVATSLPKDTYDVSAAVGGSGVLVDLLKHEGFKVYALKNLKRNISLFQDIQSFFSLMSILRSEKPDILHINSSKAGALGSLAGRICRVPKIVFTAHGWAFNEDRPLWQKIILKTIHYVTVLLCHNTIAVSHQLKSQMDWLGAQQKISVVHLGRAPIDFLFKNDARGVLETKVTNTTARLIDFHDDFWIGTIAELHPIKRLNRAIDAVSALVKKHNNLRFIIIHDGELRTQLEQQVRDLGLEEHVFFTGTIDNAARFLKAFDLFVLPSKSEAFGYVLIEAGQAGIPVVATNVGGIPDIITDNVTGLLVPPDDTPALTNAIRTMLTDNELRMNLARAHHEKSLTFTIEKMLGETIAIYNLNK